MTANGLSMACDLRLCLHSENKEHKLYICGLLSYFEKKKFVCQWSERMHLCGFVAGCVCVCVVGANKVGDTMS